MPLQRSLDQQLDCPYRCHYPKYVPRNENEVRHAQCEKEDADEERQLKPSRHADLFGLATPWNGLYRGGFARQGCGVKQRMPSDGITLERVCQIRVSELQRQRSFKDIPHPQESVLLLQGCAVALPFSFPISVNRFQRSNNPHVCTSLSNTRAAVLST